MKLIFLIAGFLIFLVVASKFFFGGKTGDTDGGQILIKDIPDILDSLKTTGSDGAFAVLLIPNTELNDGYTANLQFSIENGSLGLDWVLLAERNKQDKEKVTNIVESSGCLFPEETVNEVTYLRCTDSKDFFSLSAHILEEVYEINAEATLNLIVTGFNWEKKI